MAITIPNTFVAGTKIEASPMNANFAEVANAVDKRGDTVTGNIAANAGVKFDGVDLSTIPNSSGTFDPLFAQVVIGTADTNGIRLDLETGTLAVREGDDSAYGPLNTGALEAKGVLTVTAGAVGAPAITTTGDTNTGVYFPAADTVAITTGGTERVRITPAGNVGLGTAPGAYTGAGGPAFEIGSKGNVLLSNSAALTLAFNGDYSSGWLYGTSNLASYYQQINGVHVWATAPTGTAGNAITFSEKMRLTNTGHLQPGTNDGGQLGVSGTAWSDLFLASGGVINFNAGDVTITHATDALTFAGAASGYTFNDGQFILSKGTTSEYKMYISGTGGSAGNYVGLLMHASGSSSAPLYSGGVQLLMTASSPSFLDPSLVFMLQDAGTSAAASVTEKMRLNGAGELTIGYGATDNGAYKLQVNSQIFATNATIATSDGRFKDNVQPVSDGLRLISALKPVQFTWKPHDVHNFIDGVDVGFIAQDVEAALKGCDYSGAVVKKNGEGDNEFLGMADSKLIPLLVAAVQELNAEVVALKARLN